MYSKAKRTRYQIIIIMPVLISLNTTIKQKRQTNYYSLKLKIDSDTTHLAKSYPQFRHNQN